MWSDQETTRDCLGFETYVESLASVCLAQDIAPLTLGVFGSWGSGKTSLMKMLQGRIRQEQKVKTVWANAWRYEGKEEMQSALVHAILTSVTEDQTLSDEVKDLLGRINPTSPTQHELCRFSLFSTTQVIELLNPCTPNSPQYRL